jgi:outer membrane lipoprotein carrier protein
MKNLVKSGKFFLFSLVAVVGAAYISDARVNRLSAEDRDIFNRANAYFKNIETLKSNFVQTNEFDQSTADGILYISRPNRFRFEYFSPTESLIVGSGKIISHYDLDLDEISVVSTSIVPLIFLMEKNRGLEDMDLNRVRIKRVGNEYIIATELADADNTYKIEYIFDKNIKTLHGINIHIDENQKIFLTLLDTRINLKLNGSLFVFKNPRLHNRRE